MQWILGSTHGNPTREERKLVGGIYLSWSRYLKQQPAGKRMEVLKLLEQGIQISPESQDLIMAFLGDCEELTSEPAERQRYVERILSNGGISSSFLHYYLGVMDWKQGNRESAKSHFELASSLNPGSVSYTHLDVYKRQLLSHFAFLCCHKLYLSQCR